MNENKLPYPTNIQGLLDNIKKQRFQQPEEVVTYCNQLLTYADSIEDTYLRSFAHMHLGDAYLSLGKLELSLQNLHLALPLQEQHAYSDLLCITYNLIGVNYCSQGDTLLSIDYWYKGLLLSLSCSNYAMCSKYYSNIGFTYLQYGDSVLALENFNKCEHMIEKCADRNEIGYVHSIMYLNYAHCYYALRKYDEALRYLKQSKEIMEPYTYQAQYLDYESIHAKLLYQLQQPEEAYTICKTIADLPVERLDYLEFFDHVLEVVYLLLELHKIDDAYQLLSKLSRILKSTPYHSKCLCLLKAYITYFQEVHNTTALQTCLRLYYEHYKKQEQENVQVIIKSIENRLFLEQENAEYEQLRKGNLRLSQLSTKDALTGLGNRYGLSTYNQTQFAHAKTNQLTYGIMIVDIDNLKKFNDSLGHIEGDRCIRTIASCIQKTVSSDCYVARYGGDEFFIIHIGKTSEELRGLAEQLLQEVESSHLCFEGTHGSECITLSIGIANGIPTAMHEVTHFIHLADNELYRVKRKTKNWYSITEVH